MKSLYRYDKPLTRRFVTIVAALVVAISTALAWGQEYHSCQRSNGSRVVISAVFQEFGLDKRVKTADGKQVQSPRKLTCLKLLPDHR